MNHTFIYRSDEQNTRYILSLNPDLKFIRIQMGLTEIKQGKKNVYTVIKKEDIKVLIIIEKNIFLFFVQ